MTSPSRIDLGIQVTQLIATSALLLYFLLELFVAAHPVERSRGMVTLAAALVCLAAAPLVGTPARRILGVAASLLVVATFWMTFN
jgi:hypothetical protein